MHITIAQVIDTLDQIMSEVPADYTYADRYREITGHDPRTRQCTNVLATPSGVRKPACIVGDVLARLGLHVTTLYEDFSIGGLFSRDFLSPVRQAPTDRFAEDGTHTLDLDAYRALCEAQVVQDSGHPWHVAVLRAHEAVGVRV